MANKQRFFDWFCFEFLSLISVFAISDFVVLDKGLGRFPLNYTMTIFYSNIC